MPSGDSQSSAGETRLTWPGVGRGFLDLIGPSVFAGAIGVLFGISAREAGLDSLVAGTMSALVFAGSAQFAALELWDVPVPWTAIILTTLAINARHVLYGATLYAWLQDVPSTRRYLIVSLLNDLNWAASRQARLRGETDVGHLLGGGLMTWACWLGGTVVGAVAGDQVGNPRAWGLDVILPAFFACTLVGMTRSRLELAPWLVAAAAAVIAATVLPPAGYLLVGVAAGAVAGWLLYDGA